MFESADGLLAPWTRQNEGRFDGVVSADTASVPDVTGVAEMIEVLPSKVSVLRSAHPVAPRGARAVGVWGLACATMVQATAPATTYCNVALGMAVLPLIVIASCGSPRRPWSNPFAHWSRRSCRPRVRRGVSTAPGHDRRLRGWRCTHRKPCRLPD